MLIDVGLDDRVVDEGDDAARGRLAILDMPPEIVQSPQEFLKVLLKAQYVWWFVSASVNLYLVLFH